MPTFLNDRSKTEVEMVYENDRRLVKADPVLDAKFSDIQEYEQRNDKNVNRWTVPISLGARFQYRSFHMRLAFTSRRFDSVKDYENAYKDVAFLTVGYAAGPSRRSSPQQNNYQQQPGPSAAPGTTTTTTTTNGQTTTTTTTTTPSQPAPAQPVRQQPVINLKIGR